MRKPTRTQTTAKAHFAPCIEHRLCGRATLDGRAARHVIGLRRGFAASIDGADQGAA
jgi:hypothetical protein